MITSLDLQTTQLLKIAPTELIESIFQLVGFGNLFAREAFEKLRADVADAGLGLPADLAQDLANGRNQPNSNREHNTTTELTMNTSRMRVLATRSSAHCLATTSAMILWASDAAGSRPCHARSVSIIFAYKARCIAERSVAYVHKQCGRFDECYQECSE
jgi:hypothetical protein